MNYKEIPKDYTWHTTVSSFDVGANRRMTPSAILRMQQEVGGRHLDGTRAELEALIADKVAFLSVQSRVKVTRLPLISEKYSLTTWARNNQRARFYRCYKGVDAAGLPLFDGVTSFVYVNFETHKILRPTEFEKLGMNSVAERMGDCPDPDKLKLPEGLKESPILRRVSWSDTDWNGHLNNTVYADIMFDYLPPEIRKLKLEEFTISYISECRLDEVLIISTKVEEVSNQAKVWILGEVERDGKLTRCFEGVGVFSKFDSVSGDER